MIARDCSRGGCGGAITLLFGRPAELGGAPERSAWWLFAEYGQYAAHQTVASTGAGYMLMTERPACVWMLQRTGAK